MPQLTTMPHDARKHRRHSPSTKTGRFVILPAQDVDKLTADQIEHGLIEQVNEHLKVAQRALDAFDRGQDRVQSQSGYTSEYARRLFTSEEYKKLRERCDLLTKAQELREYHAILVERWRHLNGM